MTGDSLPVAGRTPEAIAATAAFLAADAPLHLTGHRLVVEGGLGAGAADQRGCPSRRRRSAGWPVSRFGRKQHWQAGLTSPPIRHLGVVSSPARQFSGEPSASGGFSGGAGV